MENCTGFHSYLPFSKSLNKKLDEFNQSQPLVADFTVNNYLIGKCSSKMSHLFIAKTWLGRAATVRSKPILIIRTPAIKINIGWHIHCKYIQMYIVTN